MSTDYLLSFPLISGLSWEACPDIHFLTPFLMDRLQICFFLMAPFLAPPSLTCLLLWQEIEVTSAQLGSSWIQSDPFVLVSKGRNSVYPLF